MNPKTIRNNKLDVISEDSSIGAKRHNLKNIKPGPKYRDEDMDQRENQIPYQINDDGGSEINRVGGAGRAPGGETEDGDFRDYGGVSNLELGKN